MKVLVACECCGTVRDASIKKGHDAVSCDLLPSNGVEPDQFTNKRKVKMNVLECLKKANELARAAASFNLQIANDNNILVVIHYREEITPTASVFCARGSLEEKTPSCVFELNEKLDLKSLEDGFALDVEVARNHLRRHLAQEVEL